jgi:hypothetical protein
MNNKKIKFTAVDRDSWDIAEKPFPAKQAVPDWWKNLSPYIKTPENPAGNKLIVKDFQTNHGAKKCIPMLDALTAGYIIPLWTDVYVRQANGRPEINWKVSQQVFTVHQLDSREIESPTGYSNFVVKYHNKWLIQTPKNYSIICTQPFGYKSSPFHAVPAIVDSDRSSLELLFPLWLKNDFEGVIEKGTPIAQIIPFKRDSWNAEFDFLENGEYKKIENKNFNSTIVGHYLKNVWSKKEFN